MRLASYLPGELIPCAFVWLDPGITPCCRSRLSFAANSDSVAPTLTSVGANDDGAAQSGPRGVALLL
jgi:hypothetical protein